MTTVAVLADPPREGVVLPDVSSSLSPSAATTLYRAMLGDVTEAVQASGGDTIVNFRDDDALPEGDGGSESELREALGADLASLEGTRFEVQVGSSYYARVGNTITHLLEREGTDTAAVVDPTAPFLTRSVIDSAAMKLRSADVVLGPATDGRLYYAGFNDPIDFTDAFATPSVETLTRRARDEGLSVDFLQVLPTVETVADLATVVPLVRAREAAGRRHPQRTAAAIEKLGLRVEDDEGEAVVVQG